MSQRTAITFEADILEELDALLDDMKESDTYEGLRLTRTSLVRMACTIGIRVIRERIEFDVELG